MPDKTRKVVLMQRMSQSGLKRVGMNIMEEFLRELQFPEGLKHYEEMRKNSGVVGGFLRAIDTSFRSVNWFTLPADDSPEAAKLAAFHESVRRDMRTPFSGFVSDAITFLPFGFSAMEMWFKRRLGRQGDPPSRYSDNKIGFANIDLIGQDSVQGWDWDEEDPNKLNGIIQYSAIPGATTIIIPRDKFLLFRTKAEKDNPEGESILRQAYYHYYSMQRLEMIEMISLERTGAGIPTVKLPQNASTIDEEQEKSDEQAALDLVKSIRVDEQGGVVLPYGWEFELVRPTGRVDPQLFDLAIKRHRASMLMSVLAVFLELGTSRVGSFALAEQGRSFFETAFEAYVMSFEETYNDEAIPLLFELNGVTDSLPRLSHTSIAGTNIEAITDAIEKMTAQGYLDPSDPLISDYLKDLMRLPRGDSVADVESLPERREEQPQQQPSTNGNMDTQDALNALEEPSLG